MINASMNFYIYKIEHIETKEFYFGSRKKTTSKWKKLRKRI